MPDRPESRSPDPDRPASGWIIVERRDAVATLVLNNPAKRNALNLELLAELQSALEALAREGICCLIIRGAGDRSFCSGFDISAIPTRIPPSEFSEKAPRNLVQMVVGALEDFPIPTIAMINGHAWGAGCELITACDLRVAVPEATFGMPPARLGLVYSPKGLTRFIDLIGVASTKEMFFTALPVQAGRALEMGLVNRLAPRPELEGVVNELADVIAGNAPMALRGMKRLIAGCVAERPISSGLEAEAARLVAASFASEDLVEGQAAFLEGRKPRFKGR